MNPRSSASSPFVGKSILDGLLRKVDWSKSSVGVPENWPGTWRAAARMCLDCAFPMVILLGEDFRMLYNDAAIPVIGGRHPGCLGKSAALEWPEVWEHPIGPMVMHAIATSEPTVSEDLFLLLERNGFPEETYMVLATSAIRDIEHEAGAALVTIHETTERVLVARLIECLDALATRCFTAETTQEACINAAEVVARYPRDLPFSLIYLIDADGSTARLAASSGLQVTSPEIAPAVVQLVAGAANCPWDIDKVALSGKPAATHDVRAQIAPLLLEAIEPPNVVLTMPLADPSGGATGILVVGTNPWRRVAECQKLAGAVAERITTAIANARVKQHTRERAEALAALDRAKTLFLSDVSHEFRTPLTLLLSPLEEVLSNSTIAEGDRELLQTARRAATRLLKLVQSLLDFSRVEAGRLQAAFEPTDLASATADLVSLFRSAFEQANLILIVDCPPLPEAVYVDRDMWEKIVLNLVANAFKFTLQGEVRVTMRAQEDWVVVEVTDTGCGVMSEDLHRVFDRFHRGKTANARSAEGSGIGLSLVQELVKLHGGSVGVTSEVGQGASFTVRIPRGVRHLSAEQIGLPRRAPSAGGAVPFLEEVSGWVQDRDVHPPSAVAQRPVAQRPGDRILVVDDNADMRRYLKRILQQHWTVETATDGLLALAKLRKSPPDLLIADIMMPGLDGLSLLGAIRNDPKLAELPVMVLSARANEDASVESLTAGADDYLPKPFFAKELTARVGVQLARARLRYAERVARETAEETGVMKDELVGMLSRSLREPLNVLLNTISMLKEHHLVGPDAQRAIDLIRASTHEQHRLIDEVHDISCIAADCFQVNPKRISSLSALVTAEVEALRPIASAKRVRLDSFFDAIAGPIQGDEVRLSQVAHSLVSHAIACTGAGGNVFVECRRREESVELLVRDSGIGISPEALPHLFEPLWQIQHARAEPTRNGAIGLGLAVTHRIVELHGGTIRVVSAGRNRGATFIVRFPARAASRAVAAKALRSGV